MTLALLNLALSREKETGHSEKITLYDKFVDLFLKLNSEKWLSPAPSGCPERFWDTTGLNTFCLIKAIR